MSENLGYFTSAKAIHGFAMGYKLVYIYIYISRTAQQVDAERSRPKASGVGLIGEAVPSYVARLQTPHDNIRFNPSALVCVRVSAEQNRIELIYIYIYMYISWDLLKIDS